MSPRTQLFCCAVLIVYFAAVIITIKSKVFILKYAIVWIVSGIVLLSTMFNIGAFQRLCMMLGFEDAMNGLFVLLIGCMGVIIFSLTIIVSRQTKMINSLIQRQAILEAELSERIDGLSKSIKSMA